MTAQSSDVDRLAKTLEADERLAAALVFGSAARDALRADSDVDIAFLARDAAALDSLERDPLEWLGSLGQSAMRDVHPIDLERSDASLRYAILTNGRVLFDRSEGALHALRARSAVKYLDDEYLRRIVDAGHRRRLERSLG